MTAWAWVFLGAWVLAELEVAYLLLSRPRRRFTSAQMEMILEGTPN